MKLKLIGILLLMMILAGCSGDVDPAEKPVQWVGIYELEATDYNFHFGAVNFENIKVGIVKLEDDTDLSQVQEGVIKNIEGRVQANGYFLVNSGNAYMLDLDPNHTHHVFNIPEAGRYAFILERPADRVGFILYSMQNLEMIPEDAYDVD